MRKARFYYLLRRGLLTGAASFITEGLVMASKFITQGLTFPAQGSAEFNGTSDYIDTGIANESWPSVYSVSFWANVKSGSIDSMPFTIGNGYAGDGFFFQYRASTNAWEFWFSTTGLQVSNTAYSNEWAYISMTYNGSVINLYKDGSLIGSVNGTILAPTTYLAQIGKYKDGALGYWMDGNLANVAIWNRALTSDEINSVMWKPYQALNATESNGLQAWYSLDDIASPTASLATMEQLATDKNLTIENTAAITAAINSLS